MFGLELTSFLKCYFLNVCLFHFSKFQMTIVKNLMEKPSYFKIDFEGSDEVLLRRSYFLSAIFYWQ